MGQNRVILVLKTTKNKEACPVHGGGSASSVHWASWRRGKLPFLLTEPPFPAESNSQREHSERNHMWEPACRLFCIHTVALRFIRSFEEWILIMVVLVNPGYGYEERIRHIPAIAIGVAPPFKGGWGT